MNCEHRKLKYIVSVKEEDRQVLYGRCRLCNEVVEIDDNYELFNQDELIYTPRQKAWSRGGRE